MKKVAVVYWSGTGNTEEMANNVAEGAKSVGGDVSLILADDFGGDKVSEYDAIAFGSPSMGDEVLEEGSVEPMFSDCESKISGKPVGLFGSYGWGDGQWMRDWEERTKTAGANLVGGGGVICQEAPDDTAKRECFELGEMLAK